MKKMKTVLCIALLSAMNTAIADDIDLENGEQLHAENCVNCHHPTAEGDHSHLYTREEERKANDIAGIESMVRMCDSNLNTGWFDEEIFNVSAYLNKTYYKFDTNAKKKEKE